MTPDLRSLPPFARAAFEQVFGTPRRHADHAREERQEVAPEERQPSSPASGVPPFARAPRGFAVQPVQAVLALAGILLLSMGPAASGRAASARPPADPPGAAATYSNEELRADGQLVAGADELRTCAKDPGGREQHAVQHGAGSSDGIETGRRTGDEQHPTRAGNSVGRRESEEGGPPTPLAAANLIADLDLAARRIEALEAHRALAGECVAVCPLGVEWVQVGRAEAECRCRKAASLGVYRFDRSSSTSRGARAPEERGQRLSQRASEDEPGAVAESGGAGSTGGGSR